MTTAKFTENGFTAQIEFTGSKAKQTLGKQVLKMCRTMDDVQRCASMGDFRIARYDLPIA